MATRPTETPEAPPVTGGMPVGWVLLPGRVGWAIMVVTQSVETGLPISVFWLGLADCWGGIED